MANSSIHIGNSSASALLHNTRVFKVEYAIDKKEKNDNFQYHQIQVLVQTAKDDYKKNQKHNRSMNKNAKLTKEAIVNLNEHHTLDDLKKLCSVLKKEFGYEPMHISIHRDEGHIDVETKEKKYNYHAHIMLLNYDFEKHRTIRPTKTTLSKIQTVTAECLNMTRGVDKRISKKVRLNTFEYKRLKEEESKKIQGIKQEFKYNFKELQKKITSLEDLTNEQKKELHQLNSKVKNSKATISELENKVKEIKKDLIKKELVIKQYFTFWDENKKEIIKKEKEIQELLESNKELEKDNKKLKNEEPKIKYVEVENPLNTELENEVSYIKSMYEKSTKKVDELESKVKELETKVYHPTMTVKGRKVTNEEASNFYKSKVKEWEAYAEKIKSKIKYLEGKVYHPTLTNKEGKKATNEGASDYYESKYNHLNKFVGVLKEQLDTQSLDEIFEFVAEKAKLEVKPHEQGIYKDIELQSVEEILAEEEAERVKKSQRLRM